MPHILIAESMHEDAMRTTLASYGAILHEGALSAHSDTEDMHFYYHPTITPDALEEVLHVYDGLIVRPKTVSAKAIDNAMHLKLIIRGGAGVNAIACDKAQEKNVIVENTPGQNSIATAEFAFLTLMELLAKRPVRKAHKDVMQASENALLALKPEPYCASELYGKTLGIIGLGNIGQAMAIRARAFGMHVKTYSASFTEGHIDMRVIKLDVDPVMSVEEACKDVDAVTLHAPLTDVSRGMINNAVFSTMREGTVLINTARPQLIDVDACGTHMSKLGGLAIDGDSDVLLPFVAIAKKHPTIPALLTHHIADCTYEAQANITRQVLEQAKAYFVDDVVVNKVV